MYSSRSPTLWGITCASQGVKSLCHYTSCSHSLVLTDCQGDPNEQLVGARLLWRPVCLQSPCSFRSPGSLTFTSPMMSSMTTSYWTTKSAMMPELEKADWSCSIGQKVIRTQVSPLSVLVDGGKSPSPVWLGRAGMGWHGGLTWQKARQRVIKRSNICTTCCSSCLQRLPPAQMPHSFLSKS